MDKWLDADGWMDECNKMYAEYTQPAMHIYNVIHQYPEPEP